MGTYTKDDIRLWLETVHDGYSPIMATGNYNPDGTPEYVTHDYTDYHPASNLLWGRKTQGRVTTASGYELEGPPPLPNERDFKDGVGCIDSITCSKEQIDILDYVMHGPGNSPSQYEKNGKPTNTSTQRWLDLIYGSLAKRQTILKTLFNGVKARVQAERLMKKKP